MNTNRIAERLSIRYPIFQAPMGRTAPPRLAASVTNAGGLGMLGTSWDAPNVMREKIRATRVLTQGPFAVNLAMPWDQHERLEIALEEGVKAVSLFWGDPAPYLRKACGRVGHADRGDAGRSAPRCRSWRRLHRCAGCRIRRARRLQATSAESRCHRYGVYEIIRSSLAGRAASALRNSTVRMWENAGCPTAGKRPCEGEIVGAFPNGDPIRRYGVPAPMQGATGKLKPSRSTRANL